MRFSEAQCNFAPLTRRLTPWSRRLLHNTQTDTTCGKVGSHPGRLAVAFAGISSVWVGINVTLRDPPLGRTGVVRWFS